MFFLIQHIFGKNIYKNILINLNSSQWMTYMIISFSLNNELSIIKGYYLKLLLLKQVSQCVPYFTSIRMHVGMVIKVSIMLACWHVGMVQGYTNDLEPLDNIEYNFINSHSISFNAKNYLCIFLLSSLLYFNKHKHYIVSKTSLLMYFC